ncbi:DUF1499 domain-containing protein [Motiliproteus coralliicola]|uniref:DUF1499 domain-containing protein n=2 Tax=Motiliproteus coralliicola TaxID=2283196 RepID=A0A369WN30_9GAMM|nr:DUF1499 domain-containing protein [Motiliproteus coralliicola]
MVNTILILALLLLVLQNLSFFYKARQSQQAKLPGLVEGRLAPCGSRPNCVSSEPGTDPQHLIEAFDIAKLFPALTAEQALAKLAQQLERLGGKALKQQPDYRGFEFHSRWYGFVDDVELRLDPDRRLIHIRSASRVGYSDLGANRRRVEALRAGLSRPD